MRFGYGLFLTTIAACGSGMTSSSPPPPAPPPPPPPALNTVFVTISEYQYAPDTITIMKGTPVRWTNQGTVSHSVISDSAGVFSSGSLSSGGVDTYGMPYAGMSWDRSFPTAGTYLYHCSFHANMHGVVIVMN
jgi:plastocyanin